MYVHLTFNELLLIRNVSYMKLRICLQIHEGISIARLTSE